MADWREGAGKPKPRKPKNTPQPTAKSPKEPTGWRDRRKSEGDQGGKKSGKAYLQDNTRKGPKNIGILNLLLFALVVLVGSFVAIIGCQPTKTPMFYMATLQHDDPLWEPNAYAQEDRENFILSMDDSAANIELTTGQEMAVGSDNQKPWLDLNDDEFTSAIQKYLDTANGPGGPRPGGWVFYLSCHGVTNYDAIPYLVAKNSRALDPQQPDSQTRDDHLVPLESILQTISEHPKVQRNPKSFKLIVLDMGRMESQWSADRLCGNFAQAAQTLANQLPTNIQLSNTYILLSNSDGQKAWANPWESGTNFGLFFGRGLMGDANETVDSRDDDSISLGELHRYLTKQVDDWAVQHFNSRQIPVLIPVGQSPLPDSVLLSRVGDSSFQIKPSDASSGTGAKRLAEYWEAIEFLGDNGALRLAPARFSLIQYQLTRAESFARGGIAYQSAFTQAAQSLNQSIADLAATLAKYDAVVEQQIATSNLAYFQGSSVKKNVKGTSSFPIGSLAAWNAIHARKKPEIPTLEDLTTHNGKVADEAKADDIKSQDKAKPLVCPDYYVAADSLLNTFSQQREMTPTNINLVVEYLLTAPNSPVTPEGTGTHAVEVEFLVMLGKYLELLDADFGIQPSSFDATDYRIAMSQLLESRRRLERIVIVEDERVFPWLEPVLDDAEETRRNAEDLLFALNPKEAIKVATPLTEGAQGLEAIEKKKARLTEAYLVADCVRASVPFLLEWLTHQPYADDVRKQRISQAVAALEKCHELVNQLTPPKLEGDVRPNYGKAPIPDEALVQEIAGKYTEVVSFLNREYQDLTDDQGRKSRADSETLLSIHNLMRVRYVAKLNETVSTYNRNQLRSLVSQLTSTSHSISQSQTVNNASTKPEVMSPLKLGLTAYEQSPWKLALGQAGGAADFEVMSLTPDRFSIVDKMLTEAAPTVLFANKVMMQSLESTLNPFRKIETFANAPNAVSASAFTGTVVENQSQIASNRSTPSQIDYRSQRKEHLAWLANCELEDFWGNDPQNPYFERQSQLFLTAFNQESVDAPSKLAGDVNNRLSQLRRDTEDWVNMGVPKVVIGPQTKSINHPLTIQIPPTIPNGTSAIDLLNVEGKAISFGNNAGVNAFSHPFPVQPTGIYQSQRSYLQRIDATEFAGMSKGFERVRFRGHTQQFPFDIEGTKPKDSIDQIVDINPFPFVQPYVVVGGNITGSADVIFILDCSASMAKTLPNQRRQTRINAAKGVLDDILTSMATDKGKFRVLTMAFGSRMGWENGTLRAIKRPGVEVPAGIEPPNDVQFLNSENLTPLLDHDPGRNEPGVNVDRIKAEVNALQAFGETPLYYAIRLALQKVDPVKPTQIIVITDGVNEQSAEPGDPYRTSALQLITDLQRQKRPNLQLQVVGFAFEGNAKNLKITEKDTPKEDTLEELAWIAKFKGNGGFIPVDEPHKLKDEIEKLIQTKLKYSVTEKLDPSEPKLYDFDVPWYATQDFTNGKRFDYVVREWQTDSTVNIQLRGGEAIKLSYDNVLKKMIFSDDPAEITAQRQVAVTDSVSGNGTYQAQILNFQAPASDSKTLQIPVRLENIRNTLFTVRPYHIWAEIQPSATNSFKQNDLLETRYFGDLMLRNGTQFPEFLIQLRDWQPVARWARLKLFLHLDKPIVPEKTLSLLDILSGNSDSVKAETLVGNFTVQPATSVDKYKYIVMVTVEPGPEGIQPHHVEVTPTPPRIERTCTLAGDGSHKILSITHRFMYESKSDAEAAASPRVDIWTKEQLTTGAPSFTVDLQVPR